VFGSGKRYDVIHTHFDRHNRPEHARIKGYPITFQGGHYLGEVICRIASPTDLDCSGLRMIGRSDAFLACLEHLTKAAASEAPVLLVGETGVGKELAAQYLHQRSRRQEKPFVVVNCAAIAESMFEDEFFGHERGAFTGCIGRKPGLFEQADGGTLFLDEVGEIPVAMQAKLLRALESGEFRRLGGTTIHCADVRVISATNRNLAEMAERGSYRPDLYYRIAAVDIRLPPLRERRDDIPVLVESLLQYISRGSGAPRCTVTDEAWARLMNYDYPGNVRELRNILLKAVALSTHGIITAEAIHLSDRAAAALPPQSSRLGSFPPDTALDSSPVGPSMVALETQHIQTLLARHNGHRRKVAAILGISERTLYRKLKKLGPSLA
jgi:two-component system response regulator AtoC